MSRRAHDDEQHNVKPFDCVSSGQVYRDFKNAALVALRERVMASTRSKIAATIRRLCCFPPQRSSILESNEAQDRTRLDVRG